MGRKSAGGAGRAGRKRGESGGVTATQAASIRHSDPDIIVKPHYAGIEIVYGGQSMGAISASELPAALSNLKNEGLKIRAQEYVAGRRMDSGPWQSVLRAAGVTGTFQRASYRKRNIDF